MKKKKDMPKPRKPDEKKLKHRIPVTLTDTDYSGLEEFKKAHELEENSDALRRLIRKALGAWRGEGEKSPPAGS